MKTKIYSAVTMVTFLSVMLFSCKSVNKLYQKGDYDEAVLTGVKKLQKDKLKDATKELVADAYAKAINQRKENIRSLEMRSDELKWEAIANEYNRMQQLSDAINRSPEALLYVKPVDFRSEYTDAADQAATIRYNRGMHWMQFTDKQSAKNAYNEFSAATLYRSANRELEDLMNRSFDAAATYVVVNPVSARNYSFSDAARDLDRELMSYLQCNAPNIFVKYYTPWDAQRLSRPADQVVDLEFADMRQDAARTERTEREVYKDNVLLRERVIRPDSVVREYGRVSGRMFTTKETINTTGFLYITVRDANNGYSIMDRRVEGNYCYVNEYARFTGDERALSVEDKNRLGSNRVNRPSERELLSAVTRNMQQNLNNELKYFFSRY
jgi:hypothetical protein